MRTRENYRTDSNYTSNSYNAGLSSSQKKSTSSNTGNNGRESGAALNRTQKVPTKVLANQARLTKISDAKRLTDLKYEPKKTGLVTIDILSSFLGKRSFDTNKPYFQKNVGGKYINGVLSNYKASPEDYKRYIRDRSLGKVDAYGRTITESNRPDSPKPTILKKNIGGQTVQTTKAKVEENKTKSKKEYDERQTKKKGRIKNTLTSSQGVTKTSADYSLGLKSLLGQVV